MHQVISCSFGALLRAACLGLGSLCIFGTEMEYSKRASCRHMEHQNINNSCSREAAMNFGICRVPCLHPSTCSHIQIPICFLPAPYLFPGCFLLNSLPSCRACLHAVNLCYLVPQGRRCDYACSRVFSHVVGAQSPHFPAIGDVQRRTSFQDGGARTRIWSEGFIG